MNFKFSGGTARQVQWVKDAIASCSYPVASVDVTVTVQWAAQMPSGADTRHPYMLTQVAGPTSFRVTIISWADDPTNPNNQGLTNPAEDIYDFYKQSFVHELGHVVAGSTFAVDGDFSLGVPKMCGLFWRSTVDSGTGRRYGTLDDYDADAAGWADLIKEAVAECFKCAFYRGRLVFSNRTHWNIDSSSWSSFLALLAISVTGQHFERATSPSFVSIGDGEVGGGIVVPAGGSGGAEGRLTSEHALKPAAVGVLVSSAESAYFANPDDASSERNSGWKVDVGTQYGGIWQGTLVSVDVFGSGSFETGVSWSVGGNPDLKPPFWVGGVLRDDGSCITGIWLSEKPAIGSTPDIVLSLGLTALATDTAVLDGVTFVQQIVGEGVVSGETFGVANLDSFFYEGYWNGTATIQPAAPYPFGPDEIQAGAPLRGSVRLAS